MNKLSVYGLSVSFGITFTVFYIMCMIMMIFFNQDVSIFVFNSLFHGLDIRSIIIADVPFWVSIIGLIETFVLGCVMGALIASSYNCFVKNKA